MRTADVDILIIPGWTNSGPDHWQSRWQRNLKTARRVEQTDWHRPRKDDWVARIVAEVAACNRPAVLVAHSCGVAATAHAAPELTDGRVIGAFLVAPPDLDGTDAWPAAQGGFAPTPRARLPFPSLVVASSDDPHCPLGRARDLAAAWGSTLVEAGNVGHINTASGHGPWPEGLLRFGAFLRQLGGP